MPHSGEYLLKEDDQSPKAQTGKREQEILLWDEKNNDLNTGIMWDFHTTSS